MQDWFRGKRALIAPVAMAVSLLGGAGSALLGLCGPFTDVTDAAFCPFVLEIFTLGITTGTSPTTYDPTSSVSRLQMAAFLSRTVDGVLQRGSRRAALDQFWTPKTVQSLGLTTVGGGLTMIKSDGADLWVANGSAVARVRASDGRLLEKWTGADGAFGIRIAMGKVFATGQATPGKLYMIDPSQAAGAVTTVASNLGDSPLDIAFDGSRIWTANLDGASVSIVTPGPTVPWTVTTVTTGFAAPKGLVFDGANMWLTDSFAQTLLKLDGNGVILQTVSIGSSPRFPTFDGTNIWVPNQDPWVTVVRASTGAIVTTLFGNGLSDPLVAAFDGKRVLVTSSAAGVSLWKAADLTALGSAPVGLAFPFGACSDGLNFWVTINGIGQVVRF